MADGALYRLMAWLSPSYPVGAFSHSSGLEWAVEMGWVVDRAGLVAWIEDALAHGAGWNDAVLFTHAHRAAMAGDDDRLAEIADLATALAASRERQVETMAQGTAFLTISRSSWPAPGLERLAARIGETVAYPVAVAACAAGHGIALAPSLTAFLHALAANLVSAAQRLVPLGQTDGQRAIAALMPAVEAAGARALALPDGDPFRHCGGLAVASDIASMQHETQYTRLFRT
ncbi:MULTISPECIES: urease accessory protein UreF [unclassified Inquilinus]|uniref:urease accessory protein UreF n=1 Tax=unclassified Inquilinus TaxID=2645927 RepID=UPI003F8DCE36